MTHVRDARIRKQWAGAIAALAVGGLLLALTLGGQTDAQAGIADVGVPGVANVNVGGGGAYVEVFATEIQPLVRYDAPKGCVQLELGAHVLSNHTPSVVQVYAGSPNCSGVSFPYVVLPGFGIHVPPALSSFRVLSVAQSAAIKRSKSRAAAAR
jgi:hypothetical protein